MSISDSVSFIYDYVTETLIGDEHFSIYPNPDQANLF